jgi:hypothetical protein
LTAKLGLMVVTSKSVRLPGLIGDDYITQDLLRA